MVRQKILDGLRWIVGNGQRVHFWYDLGVLEDVLLFYLSLALAPESSANACVAKFVHPDGSWNCALFAYLLPIHVLFKLGAIKPPDRSGDFDHLY